MKTKEEFLKEWLSEYPQIVPLVDAEECNCGCCEGWILVEKKKPCRNRAKKKIN